MIGKTISHYQILEKLGEGGMGVVYKAHDTTLDRVVALKFLPHYLTSDPTEKKRFYHEAKAASALNHTNITTIYEISDFEGQLFIAMELVEGKTLKQLVEHEILPVKTILDIAIQVCDGLTAAHEKGIVHRDIKSENIMVTPRGQAKIMDFGLAKVKGATKLTKESSTLGTAAYMSPEQAQGEEVDLRSDIFSFGVVLYEMLTGKLPFKGEHHAALMYSIINEEPPPVARFNEKVGPEIEHIVTKALSKDRDERYQHSDELLADLRHERKKLEYAKAGYVAASGPSVTPKPKRRWMKIATFGVGVFLVTILAILYNLFNNRRGPLEIKIGQTRQLTNAPGLEIDPAISPDGKMIAYAAGPIGQTHLYARQLTGGQTIALTTDLPGYHRGPQWSPDGTQIVFFSRQPTKSGGPMVYRIYLIPSLGGTPKRLLESPLNELIYCPTWLPDGKQIAYATRKAIFIRSIDGGESRKIVEAFLPHSLRFSPDGRRLAYVSGNDEFIYGTTHIGNIAPSSIWIESVTGGDPYMVTDKVNLNMSPIWSPDGKHLLFVSNRGGNRDVYQLPVSTSSKPSGAVVRLTTGLNAHTINLSADGKLLVYSVFTYNANIWSIRIPEEKAISVSEARPVTTGNQAIEGIGVSPDGQWLVFDSNRSGNQDIYKMPVAGGEYEQLTTDPADDFLPSWSLDGTEIVFYSWRNGNRDMYLMSADGDSLLQLTNAPGQEYYPDWSPDGKQLVFLSNQTGRDELYLISKEDAESKWSAPQQLTFDGASPPRWSPDGRLIAYAERNSLRVISPEGGDPRVIVESQDRARTPVPGFADWSSDGKTVYYKAYDTEQRSSFWSVPALGGRPKLLVTFDDPFRQSNRQEFATDGKHFFFTIGKHESDIWVMELLTRK